MIQDFLTAAANLVGNLWCIAFHRRHWFWQGQGDWAFYECNACEHRHSQRYWVAPR